MKQTAVLFLGLFFHVLPAAQDLPPEILVDQYLLEATKAIENGDLNKAYMKFEDIEDLDVEPPLEFLFLYGKLLVEDEGINGDRFFDDYLFDALASLQGGEKRLKQYVLNTDKSSEYYKPALELLLIAEEKIKERNRQFEESAYAEQQAALKPMGEMVSIPGGKFMMGLLNEVENIFQAQLLDSNQMIPAHAVTVRPFKLGKYEVTFAQWDACVEDGGCKTERDPEGYIPDDEDWIRGNYPVINVSWDDAQLFIDWLNSKTGGNYRLPTEAEWEYAARAGSTTRYSWGDDIGVNRANCIGCGSQWDEKQTAPVGSFPANAWGLYDMHGNVSEWVQDCYHENYEGAPSDGSAWTSSCRTFDIEGEGLAYKDENYTDSDSWRVLRGGSWYSITLHLCSGYRESGYRRKRYGPDRGFRLAQDN